MSSNSSHSGLIVLAIIFFVILFAGLSYTNTRINAEIDDMATVGQTSVTPPPNMMTGSTHMVDAPHKDSVPAQKQDDKRQSDAKVAKKKKPHKPTIVVHEMPLDTVNLLQ